MATRVDRYKEVLELSREGMSQQAISKKLHMGERPSGLRLDARLFRPAPPRKKELQAVHA